MNATTASRQVSLVRNDDRYDVRVDGVKVGYVKQASAGRMWAFCSTAPGVYSSGSWCRTRSSAVDTLVAVTAGWIASQVAIPAEHTCTAEEFDHTPAAQRAANCRRCTELAR